MVLLLAVATVALIARLGMDRRAEDFQGRRLTRVALREHELGIRPCSRPDCPSCILFLARVAPGRRHWSPQSDGPPRIEGEFAAVETAPKYGTEVTLYYLDPIGAGDGMWTVEASHRLLADGMSRFVRGDRVRIDFGGSRVSSSSGRQYFVYEVQQLP